MTTEDDSQVSPLHEAVQQGDLDALTQLLDQGADVDTKGSDGRTPLHMAAEKGNVAVVRLLIDRGATVTVSDRTGRGSLWGDVGGNTPLHRAAFFGHVEAAAILLRAGADPNVPSLFGWTPLNCACSPSHSDTVSENRVREMVALLLAHGAKPNTGNCDGRVPLIDAAVRGFVDVVNLLLSSGADVNAQADNGETALILAALSDRVEVVRLLLAHGADTHACDGAGYTPLKAAQLKGNAEIVKLLREHSEERVVGATEGLRFLKELDQGADVVTSELIEFIRRLWNDRQTEDYYRGLVALLGRALHQPEFFRGWPLTRCPRGLNVDLNPKDEPAQLGIRFLRENSIGLRNAVMKAGMANWRDTLSCPHKSCRAITESVSDRFSKAMAPSFRMAVAFVVLLLWFELLGDSFWPIPDHSLAGAIAGKLEEENKKR